MAGGCPGLYDNMTLEMEFALPGTLVVHGFRDLNTRVAAAARTSSQFYMQKVPTRTQTYMKQWHKTSKKRLRGNYFTYVWGRVRTEPTTPSYMGPCKTSSIGNLRGSIPVQTVVSPAPKA